jgi:hypothetical protein
MELFQARVIYKAVGIGQKIAISSVQTFAKKRIYWVLKLKQKLLKQDILSPLHT